MRHLFVCRFSSLVYRLNNNIRARINLKRAQLLINAFTAKQALRKMGFKACPSGRIVKFSYNLENLKTAFSDPDFFQVDFVEGGGRKTTDEKRETRNLCAYGACETETKLKKSRRDDIIVEKMKTENFENPFRGEIIIRLWWTRNEI